MHDLPASSPDSPPPRTSGKVWQPPKPEDLQPELPQYEILGLVGRGGMGAVYKARQKSLKREVAIKVLPPLLEEGGTQFAERFKAEAESMARLNHPGVVAVYDAGETPGGLLYIVMEFVQGTDVAQMIRAAGRLPPEHAYAITAHVCDALAYAHAHGLIHRDIKPANIMVDQEGRVKVADFGLAKRLTDEQGFTQSHMAVGTPDFLAPEALIDGIAVDGRADIYALGVMLYQMLTGSIPRGAWHPASVVVPGVDPRFDQIIHKALQYDREQRHSSAVELRKHMDTLLMPAVPAPDLQRYTSAHMPKTPPDQPRQAASPQANGAHAPPQPSKSAAAPPSKSNSTGTPSAQGSAAKTQSHQAAGAPVKSKTPLFIGIGAVVALGIGAFVMFGGGGKPVSQTSAAFVSLASAASHYAETAESWQDASKLSAEKVDFYGGAKKSENGFLIPGGGAIVRRGGFADGAIRIRPTLRDSPLDLHVRESNSDGSYILRLEKAKTVLLMRWDSSAKRNLPIREFAPTETVTANRRYELELIIVGDRLTAKLDGVVLGSVNDSAIAGRGNFSVVCPGKEAPATIVETIEFLDLDPPSKATLVTPSASPSTPTTASKETPFVNILGMKFVPVTITGGPTQGQRVLFSIWDTRVADYAAYADANPKANGLWKSQYRDGVPVGNGPDHPVVGLSWEDAQSFCQWLTEKESANGKLPKGFKYRLPSDEEWSLAVGLAKEEGVTPAEKSKKNDVDFPWGFGFPPAGKVGNYADEAFHAKFPFRENVKKDTNNNLWINGYTDGYATTSPVGSFPANAYGLYDMGGNVNQWCEDWFDTSNKERVLRGAAWYVSRRQDMLSSWRFNRLPDDHNGSNGFRCVLSVFVATAPATSATTPAASKNTAPPAVAPRTAVPATTSTAIPATEFPPGQWVKVFNRAENLPEDLSKSGVKFENGWLRLGQKRSWINLPKNQDRTFLQGNYGIRLRFLRHANHSEHVTISARWQPKYIKRMYTLRLGQNFLSCARTFENEPGYTNLFEIPCFGIPKAGEEGTLEFYVVGTRLFGRTGPALVGTAVDDQYVQGPAQISGSEDLRDIEFINLDGLSEAEARKIMGVDEKGNDTRAAAFAAENQALEQARLVDAVSAIQELKALHDQFAKLTAERVSGPFDADVDKLNTGYVGGIERKIAEETAAGHLDGVLALEAEKKLIQGGGVASSPSSNQDLASPAPCPIPAEDAEGTTANLKALRTIYRTAYAKIEAARAAGLKLLTDPLTLRLKTLETELTKQKRITDAKTVREYRAKLSRADSPPSAAAAATPQTVPGGASLLPMTALKDGYTNTLGMKFLPVKGTEVLFCIHEVRYKDYAAYAAENSGVNGDWKDQTLGSFKITERSEDHPVVTVSWKDAQKFCAWLSKKEGKTYRLPTDREWSIAVGLGAKEKFGKNLTPEMLSGKEDAEYPWGGDYPPKSKDKAGNYSDESRRLMAPSKDEKYNKFIEGGYDDGFPTTAPVMSFKPNKFGLYDMGGNVNELCEDWFNPDQKERVARGASYTLYDRGSLLSSARHRYDPDLGARQCGFRLVLVP